MRETQVDRAILERGLSVGSEDEHELGWRSVRDPRERSAKERAAGHEACAIHRRNEARGPLELALAEDLARNLAPPRTMDRGEHAIG